MSDSDRQGLRRRFDARLDAYLRRTLSPQDHDRVSTSVKCVASLTGDIQNKHRYAILGHRYVYFADVPPKNVKVAVHLRDVQSVQMLDDLPAFLKPKDSENTVHIQVHYHKKAKEKSDIFSSIAKRSHSIFRKTKTDSPMITTLPPTAIPLTPPSSPPPGSKTYPGQRSKSLSPKSPLLLSTQSPRQARPLPSLGASLSPKRAADVKFRLSPIHGNSNSVSMDEPSSLSATPRSPQVSSRLTSNHRSRSTNTLFAPGPLTVQQRSSSSNNLHTTSPLTEPKRQHGLLSIADVRGLNTEQETTVTEIGVMDLYILQSVSDFYHQLCVAWDNWNINQLCNTEDTQKHPKSPLLQRDHFSQLYLSLKQDLLQCSLKLEQAARLALELSTAAQRYSVIKRLFWEDCELLDFCVHQLETHLNLTTPLQHSTADRIEYSVILLDMLYQMLKETYHIKKKMVTLTRNSLISLATVIISNSLNTPHPELALLEASLKREGIEKSCGVLYELLQVCLQTRWPEADKTSLVITKVVNDIIKLPGSMDFLGRMGTYMCDVIGLKSAPVIEMAAKNQVSLHHTSFVLYCLLQHCSNDSMRLMKQCLGDNFRYYISVTRCKQVLTDCNPLSRKTLSFLQIVKSKIL